MPIELTLLREAGRLVVGPAQVEALVTVQPAFSVAPLDMAQGLEFAILGALADPFDRMIVATARTLGVPLLTADGGIEASGLVDTIWD